MSPRRSSCIFLPCLLAIATARHIPAQPESTAQPVQAAEPALLSRPAPRPDGTDGRIQLDIVVTGKHGAPVSGLDPKDFTIVDNKKNQDIVSIHAEDGSA